MIKTVISHISRSLFTLPFGEGRGGAFLLVLVLAICGCSKTSDNAELIGIAETVADRPREALEQLAAINPDSLTERDANYHAFLTLKANDKAYIDHTSDSVIVRLIDYYDGSDLYPEVLYYAGRVYSDLGDYPTSLRYFQDALDAVPDNRDNLLLRGAIASQTGRLLNTLRLYDSAIPYLKEAIRTNEELADTFNLAYDNQLLATIYMRNIDLDSAEMLINRAHCLAINLTKADEADMQMYQAVVQYKRNNLDSALLLVSGLPERVDPLCRNAALINSSDIYLAKGIRDTAYMYASELIHSTDINNQKNGYRKILSEELIDMVPHDSLMLYVRRYSSELDRYYDLNNAQQGIVQQSMYNYSLHDRARDKAKRNKKTLVWIAIIAVIIALTTSTIVLYYRYIKNKILVEYHRMSDELDNLHNTLSQKEIGSPELTSSDSDTIEGLRERIKEQLKAIEADNHGGVQIPAPSIRNSSVYIAIMDRLNNNSYIPDRSKLWGELEKVVLEASPNFYKHAQLLAGIKLNVTQKRHLLLVKCGFTHGQTAKLFCKAKGTISSRRKLLRDLLFGDDVELSRFDQIIHIL